MQLFIVFLAIFGSTLALKVAPNELENAAVTMVNCVFKAMDGGLEAAQLPDHNPLVVRHLNLTFPIDTLGFTGYAKINHMEITHLVTLNITKIEGTLTEDGSEIDYDYDLWWDKWLITSNYTLDVSGPLGIGGVKTDGDLTVSFNGVQAEGIWNMQLEPEHLNDYLVHVSSTTTDVTLTGFGLLDSTISALAGPFVNSALNNLDPKPFSNALLDVFNNEWLSEDTLYRIDLVLENCQKK